MKILIAIESTDKDKEIVDGALRFVGRLGYESKLFVPHNKKGKYRKALDEANYHFYLALPKSMIEYKRNLAQYLRDNHVDLLIRFPDTFTVKYEQFDDSIVSFINKVGTARKEFGEKPKKQIARLGAGITMERVHNG